MIAEIKDGKMIPYQSLLEALKIHGGRDRKPRIAAVGAGGKTSLLRALAAEYRMQGRKPVVTTTTHILKEDSPAFIESQRTGSRNASNLLYGRSEEHTSEL